MENNLKQELAAYVAEELKKNPGPEGVDLSAACTTPITEKVFAQIAGLVQKETAFDRQMKTLAALSAPKKRSRPRRKEPEVASAPV
jgi:hypothetical protein